MTRRHLRSKNPIKIRCLAFLTFCAALSRVVRSHLICHTLVIVISLFIQGIVAIVIALSPCYSYFVDTSFCLFVLFAT